MTENRPRNSLLLLQRTYPPKILFRTVKFNKIHQKIPPTCHRQLCPHKIPHKFRLKCHQICPICLIWRPTHLICHRQTSPTFPQTLQTCRRRISQKSHHKTFPKSLRQTFQTNRVYLKTPRTERKRRKRKDPGTEMFFKKSLHHNFFRFLITTSDFRFLNITSIKRENHNLKLY